MIFSSSCKKCSIFIKIQTVDMIVRILYFLVQTFSWSSMPMSNRTICWACYKYICSFKWSWLRSPIQTSYWHIIVLLNHTLKCIWKFPGLGIINAGHSIAITTCKILIFIIKFHTKYLTITIPNSHFWSDFPHNTSWLWNSLGTIDFNLVVISNCLYRNMLHGIVNIVRKVLLII